jgi:hypothetical protein
MSRYKKSPRIGAKNAAACRLVRAEENARLEVIGNLFLIEILIEIGIILRNITNNSNGTIRTIERYKL